MTKRPKAQLPKNVIHMRRTINFSMTQFIHAHFPTFQNEQSGCLKNGTIWFHVSYCHILFVFFLFRVQLTRNRRSKEAAGHNKGGCGKDKVNLCFIIPLYLHIQDWSMILSSLLQTPSACALQPEAAYWGIAGWGHGEALLPGQGVVTEEVHEWLCYSSWCFFPLQDYRKKSADPHSSWMERIKPLMLLINTNLRWSKEFRDFFMLGGFRFRCFFSSIIMACDP